MGSKWGSNQDIGIGDIFNSGGEGASGLRRPDYYQVVALRDRTWVILRAIRMEKFTQDGIAEDSPIYWLRKRKRPLPGQFMTADEILCETGEYLFVWRGKEFRMPTGEITTRVLPFQSPEGRPILEEIQGKYHFTYYLEVPEDWNPWDAETIKRQEEEARAENAAMMEELHKNWGLKPAVEAGKMP